MHFVYCSNTFEVCIIDCGDIRDTDVDEPGVYERRTTMLDVDCVVDGVAGVVDVGVGVDSIGDDSDVNGDRK